MTVEALAPLYPWTKSLHLISVFAWVAGLFYLPRLYVYHSAAPAGGEPGETFKVMERRLLRAIMNPAMIAAWAFGIALVLTPGVVDWKAGWWHGKLAGIAALAWLHHDLSKARKAFHADGRPRTERAWRILHANFAITAIRTEDPALMEFAFDALDRALPDERAGFYSEAMALALAPRIAPAVRDAIAGRHRRWTQG